MDSIFIGDAVMPEAVNGSMSTTQRSAASPRATRCRPWADAPIASAAVIEEILERKYPRLNAVERGSIASFSEGNSRIALTLAATARDGRDARSR